VAETTLRRRVVSGEPDQTRELGARLGAAAQAGDVFLLDGEFGSGKTVLVQGLALGLGVPTPVGSPSFVIINEHVGRLRLFHVDLYRAEQLDPELEDTVADVIDAGGVVAIEWPRLLPPDLQSGATLIRFQRGDGETRIIEIATLRDALAAAADQQPVTS
jgi:tRNA threonylcarbamoyladenosine biosynthesis protein TsaE